MLILPDDDNAMPLLDRPPNPPGCNPNPPCCYSIPLGCYPAPPGSFQTLQVAIQIPRIAIQPTQDATQIPRVAIQIPRVAIQTTWDIIPRVTTPIPWETISLSIPCVTTPPAIRCMPLVVTQALWVIIQMPWVTSPPTFLTWKLPACTRNVEGGLPGLT